MATKNIGRPIVDDARDYVLRVRMSNAEVEILDYCCEATGMNRSEMVRDSVIRQYRRLAKRKDK